MLILVADETEDIQTKAKPVVDAIIQVDKLINSPEVQAVAQGIQSFGESVAKFLTPVPRSVVCRWNSYRGKLVEFPISMNRKYMDEDYLRCLKRRGYSQDSLISVVKSRSRGESRKNAELYVKYQIKW